jgi:hypothetical protein
MSVPVTTKKENSRRAALRSFNNVRLFWKEFNDDGSPKPAGPGGGPFPFLRGL